MSRKLTPEEIQDLINAQQTQHENSVEDSAYTSYCRRCGNIECTCLWQARRQAEQNGGGTASGFLNGLGFVLFLLAVAIAYYAYTH